MLGLCSRVVFNVVDRSIFHSHSAGGLGFHGFAVRRRLSFFF